MEDELIKFETAKLAKEKGFDLEVKEYFTLGLLPPNEGLVISGIGAKPANFNEFNDTWSRPTQSLLQKWLRVVHDIDVIVSVVYTGDGKRYHCDLFTTYMSSLPSIFDTHEESLEEGLQEALKITKLN